MRILLLSVLFALGGLEVAAAADDLTCSGKPRSEYSLAGSAGNNMFDPPPGNEATQIDVGFHLTSLSDIDVISSRFRFEGYAVFEWCDPRQAFDETTEGRSTHVVFGEKSPDGYADLWIPDVTVANSFGGTSNTSRRTEIAADGTVRVSGIFS